MLQPDEYKEISTALEAGTALTDEQIAGLVQTVKELDAYVGYYRHAVMLSGQVAALIIQNTGLGVIDILKPKSVRKTKKAAEFAGEAANKALLAAAMLVEGDFDGAVEAGHSVYDKGEPLPELSQDVVEDNDPSLVVGPVLITEEDDAA
jgi:hypothetical protein